MSLQKPTTLPWPTIDLRDVEGLDIVSLEENDLTGDCAKEDLWTAEEASTKTPAGCWSILMGTTPKVWTRTWDDAFKERLYDTAEELESRVKKSNLLNKQASSCLILKEDGKEADHFNIDFNHEILNLIVNQYKCEKNQWNDLFFKIFAFKFIEMDIDIDVEKMFSSTVDDHYQGTLLDTKLAYFTEMAATQCLLKTLAHRAAVSLKMWKEHEEKYEAQKEKIDENYNKMVEAAKKKHQELLDDANKKYQDQIKQMEKMLQQHKESLVSFETTLTSHLQDIQKSRDEEMTQLVKSRYRGDKKDESGDGNAEKPKDDEDGDKNVEEPQVKAANEAARNQREEEEESNNDESGDGNVEESQYENAEEYPPLLDAKKRTDGTSEVPQDLTNSKNAAIARRRKQLQGEEEAVEAKKKEEAKEQQRQVATKQDAQRKQAAEHQRAVIAANRKAAEQEKLEQEEALNKRKRNEANGSKGSNNKRKRRSGRRSCTTSRYVASGYGKTGYENRQPLGMKAKDEPKVPSPNNVNALDVVGRN